MGYLKERSDQEQNKILKIRRKEYKHTDEIKKELSIWRKNYINKNRIKWVGNDSIPSLKFKSILRENNINFVEEFIPLEDRYFRIDISFPDKKIGIEINGEQHYERDGKLKKYYQDRHDLIEDSGWKLYEISHHLIYKEDFISELIEELKNDFNLEKIDYSFYIKEKRNICGCGCKKSFKSKSCFTCYKKTLIRKDICVCGNKKRYSSNICISCFKSNVEDKVIQILNKDENNKKICTCGREKNKKSLQCIVCFNKKDRPKNRKVDRPDYEVLLEDIGNIGYLSTGKKYGVSDNTIRKWIKRYIKMKENI